MLTTLGVLFFVGAAVSLPASPIIRKLDPLRFQHAIDSKGQYHLVDLWMTIDDIAETARFNPTATNIYHLFTRANPTVSQPLMFGNEALVANSNFDRSKRVIILIHGWRDNAVSEFNAYLVPAFLAAEDVNVLVADWSAGASTINYPAALENSISSGGAVAQFIDWLNSNFGVIHDQFHIVGHGLGGHQAGIAGRRVNGNIPYITGLDPSLVGWVNHPERFFPNDGTYTEVIHTNAGVHGFLSDLAIVDFYPNGGESMPGCTSHSCDHEMSYKYFAESIVSGGFNGRRCSNFLLAILHTCFSPGTLHMGGLRPKTGSSGVFLLFTNAVPPYSQG